MNTSANLFVITVILSLSLTLLCTPAPSAIDRTNEYIIQKCREKCISKFLHEFEFNGNPMQYVRCRRSSNCFMCWDYCGSINEAQVELARSMCRDKQFCFKGCKVACKFHGIKTFYDIFDEMSNNSWETKIVLLV